MSDQLPHLLLPALIRHVSEGNMFAPANTATWEFGVAGASVRMPATKGNSAGIPSVSRTSVGFRRPVAYSEAMSFEAMNRKGPVAHPEAYTWSPRNHRYTLPREIPSAFRACSPIWAACFCS